MTLVKFKNLSNENGLKVNPAFGSLYGDMLSNLFPANFGSITTPAVNIKETNKNYVLELAAPGLKKEDFKISLDKDVLTISFENKNETNETNEKYTRKEFVYNSFERAFTLPEHVEQAKINATYNNGILVLDLPKAEAAQPKPAKEIKIS